MFFRIEYANRLIQRKSSLFYWVEPGLKVVTMFLLYKR
jgi:hypothetical protein